MKEIFGDLFEQSDADAICITTNGSVKKDGSAVMGRGCARVANRKWNCARQLGKNIKNLGNKTHTLLFSGYSGLPYNVVAFPVKHNWYEKADLNLIKESANHLERIATLEKWRKIVLPRPGCGFGRLNWKDVKRVLEPILDDRFYVITNMPGGDRNE